MPKILNLKETVLPWTLELISIDNDELHIALIAVPHATSVHMVLVALVCVEKDVPAGRLSVATAVCIAIALLTMTTVIEEDFGHGLAFLQHGECLNVLKVFDADCFT